MSLGMCNYLLTNLNYSMINDRATAKFYPFFLYTL